MEMTLVRAKTTPECTIGMLVVPGGLTLATLEDTKRPEKIAGKTRIPAGRYRIFLADWSRMLAKYNKDFADIGHKGMLRLENVPNFEGVLIHVGNTAADTEGCILVGLESGKNAISQSRAAYRKLYPVVVSALDKGEDVYITIQDD